MPPAGPRITLVGRSEFLPPAGLPFRTDGAGGQALAEFAGRAIYQSWERAVPATATNEGFLRHLLQVGHLSVLEHAVATFHVAGLSQSAAHEMVRHRHLSISQLSPRMAPAAGGAPVEPPAVAADPELHARFTAAVQQAQQAYEQILTVLEQAAPVTGRGTVAGKQARQAARAVLPLAGATELVVTGNYRSWRHFIGNRATDAADPEIRGVAVAVLRELTELAPAVFGDFRISELPDGTFTAASPYVGEG